MNKVLIVVDVQNDFLPGGSLAVPDGDRIIPKVNQLIGWAISTQTPIFFTMDSHPKPHISFASMHNKRPFTSAIYHNNKTQMLWPDHCVVGTEGWNQPEELAVPDSPRLIRKGERQDYDSYSGFKDDGNEPTRLVESLKLFPERDTALICGLALDYCVKFTAIDAIEFGLKPVVICDASAYVTAKTGVNAIKDMIEAGITFDHTDHVTKG